MIHIFPPAGMSKQVQNLHSTSPWSKRHRIHRLHLYFVTTMWVVMFSAPQSIFPQESWPSSRTLSEADQDWTRLSDLRLSGNQLKAAENILTKWIDEHCGKNRHGAEGGPQIASNTAKRLHLSENGRRQIIVSESGDWEADSKSCSCDPNLNCRFWIIDFSDDRAATLLEFSGLGIVARESSNRGYDDLVTASNKRPGLLELKIWRYNGVRYELSRCASMRYSPDVINETSPLNKIDLNTKPAEHPCR